MKKINKLIIFLVLALAVFGVCSNLFNTKNVYAESSRSSEYFSIAKEYLVDDGDDNADNDVYLPRENAQAIKENSAVFLQDGQRIRIGLGVDKNDVEYSKRISSLTYKITVNDIVFDNQASAAMEVYGMTISRTTDGINFDLVINPKLANTDEFNYGKYTFEFTYYYTADEGIPVYTTYSYSVYILAESDYFGNAQFYNALNNSTSTIFYSNYSKANLMYLGYDYRFYNLKVVRVYQGLTTTTNLKYSNGSLSISSSDEQNATTSNHNVVISTSGTRAFVVFRNLGVYYLTYELINPFGNCEVINEFYEDPNAPTLTQTAYVFGYQMYYTAQGGLKEFKNADQSNPWIISGTSNSADVTYLIKDGLTDLNNAITDEGAIAKTNQAPVYPQTNAIINANNSEYYYFKDYATLKDNILKIDKIDGSGNASDCYKVEQYSATPLSNAGVYIVKLAYTYSSYEGGEIVQYFMFRITNDAPVVNIFTKDDNGNAVMLTNDEFTCKDVYITKSSLGIFDSKSALVVYKDTSFNGMYDLGTTVSENSEVVFTQTARYKVELSYGNSNQKGFVTYFTIDKEAISEIEFKNLYTDYSSRYYAGSTLSAPYLTNTAVALSWKEKASGATVTAEYKYFATKYSASNEASFSSDMLKVLYNSNQLAYSIPSTHILSYAGGNVPVSDYFNTYGKTALIDSEVISAGGLYIFHIYDNTGAEGQYFAVFIDKTPNSILTETDDVYKLAPNSEITTKDTTIYFGSTKLIKIDFDINGVWDEWLLNYLNDSNSTTYQAQKYLKVGINNKVYYQKDTSNRASLSLSAITPGYGYKIKAQNADGSMNESQYIFYTLSESVKTSSIYAKDSFEYYQQNSTATYWITFTTDNSRMLVSYTDSEYGTQHLGQLPIVTETGIKTTYYQPTASETLAKAGEILKLSYCIKPSDTLEVDTIILYYYEFAENDSKGTYTFSLNNPSSSITIYEKGTLNRGTEIDGELNSFIYEINKETYNGSNTRTKSGRYEIVRTYTTESVINENDPTKRKLVFIVDRNGIISTPVIGSDGQSTYFTGGAIQLQVINRYGINYYDEQTLHFYDIYYASKLSQQELVPVLTTNFLPVTVYIPKYKYGYIDSVDGSPVFRVEDSIVRYPNNDGGYGYYSNYELSATVQYYNEKKEAVGTPYVYDTALSSNFLTTNGSGNSIIAYNQAGYYEVIIKTKTEDPTKPIDLFRFVFQITYASPDFEILDTENTPITDVTTETETIYYTNKKTVRISWEDSPSTYLARINQNAIQYTINGVTKTIDTNVTPVQSSGDNKYYIDLDLERLGAYVDNTNVYITLQYYGKLEDYSSSKHFSKTVTLKVDLQAPVYNVRNLTSGTGLEFYSLRKYVDGYKYNASVDSGLFRYFAYTVDKSTFESVILAPIETGYDYCKLYYRAFIKDGVNTKYIAGGNNETDITLSDLTGQTDGTIFDNSYTSISELLSNYSNIYIEFIEEDYAGNRTVYTVYLSDMQDSTDNVISYSYLTNSSANDGDTEKIIAFNDVQKQMSLYSKYSFNLESLDLIQNSELGDLSWQLVTVNGVLYVKSPYSNGRFYVYSTYNENKENETYSLKELTTLYSSTSSQSITLALVPIYEKIDLSVYVLNKTLDVYTLSEVMNSNLYEGLLVRLPSAKTNEDNLLYATSLSIKSKLSGTFEYTTTIDAKYLKEEQELPTLNSMNLSYVTHKNARFLQIEMLGNISLNDYFVYSLTDNFGEAYSIVHIYGQTEISEPILSEGTIIESYDSTGAIVYYASENIQYRYDTTIYAEGSIEVAESGAWVSNYKYVLVKADNNDGYIVNDGKGNAVSKDSYERYFTVITYGNVFCVEMKQIALDFGNGNFGGSRTFSIDLVPNDDFAIGNERLKFEIYNALPSTLSLVSENSAVDVTGILGAGAAYAGSVIINYVYSALKFDYEMLIMDPNGNISALLDQQKITEDGTYKIIINYLGDIKGCGKAFEFTIANSDEFIYAVAIKLADGTYKNVSATGASYTYDQGGVKTTISTHYILNGEFEIILNSNLYLTAEPVLGPIDNYTYIYKISNLNSPEADEGLITEYYSSYVAISVIPQSGDILKRLVHYGGNIKENTDDLLSLSDPAITPYVTTKDEYDAGIRIAWSKYNLIQENSISVEVFYGDIDGKKYNAKIEEINSLNSIILKTSGTYYIRFQDRAGNVQLFGAYADNQYFTIKYLSSVIFEVQGGTPINYAIYDKDVTVSVPDITLGYYDVNAKPIIHVELNGEAYTGYKKTAQYTYNFTERGLYKVWFTAKIDEKDIYEAPIYFTILSSKESRVSYNYAGYTNYFIQDIKLEGVSVKDKLTNINNGQLLTVDGEKYLKSLMLHASDIKTGVGYWTFVINTNNEFEQTFEFTVWINKAVVPIKLSIENGSSTTDTIVVSFNSSNVITASGDCILKITGYSDLVLTQEKLENGDLQEVYEISISEKGSYYIEVTSLSGQLLYSSYVVKAEPLNTVSIIIIVVSVIVVGAGIVLFVLLRRKMKIR